MNINKLKKEFIKSEAEISIKKRKGADAPSVFIAGDNAMVLALFATGMDKLIRSKFFTADEFRKTIDAVEAGVKNESK